MWTFFGIFVLQKETITLKRGGEKGLGFSIAGGRGSTPYKDGDAVIIIIYFYLVSAIITLRKVSRNFQQNFRRQIKLSTILRWRLSFINLLLISLQGVFISKIAEGGTAERDGRLQVGDKVLSVSNADIPRYHAIHLMVFNCRFLANHVPFLLDTKLKNRLVLYYWLNKARARCSSQSELRCCPFNQSGAKTNLVTWLFPRFPTAACFGVVVGSSFCYWRRKFLNSILIVYSVCLCFRLTVKTWKSLGMRTPSPCWQAGSLTSRLSLFVNA